MKDYIITERAGAFVAGHRNNGAGSTIPLTDEQAEYELTLGTIMPADGGTVGKPENKKPTTAKTAAKPKA